MQWPLDPTALAALRKERDTVRRCCVKTETGVGVMLPQATKCWGPPEAEELRIIPQRQQRQHGSANTMVLEFWPPEL